MNIAKGGAGQRGRPKWALVMTLAALRTSM